MAKKLEGKWQPGFIYELQCFIENEWHPFYVGETIDPVKRKQSHQSSANANEERLVYDFIRELEDAGIEWDLEVVDNYGEEGPTDLEDEHIFRLLLADVKLQNMKKGSSNWKEKYEDVAREMRKHGFSSHRKYKEWNAEQVRKENDRKHEQRVKSAEEKQWKNTMRAKAEQRAYRDEEEDHEQWAELHGFQTGCPLEDMKAQRIAHNKFEVDKIMSKLKR